jgi:hypothetical protein
MMVKRYLFLVLITPILLILACKEQSPNDIYKEIPAKFNHVFTRIRTLSDTSIISVNSSGGLLDQLTLFSNPSQKVYTSMFADYGIPGAEGQQFYLEYYKQTLDPVLYRFYNIKYSIDFLNRSSLVAKPQDPENYYATISVQGNEIFKLGLLNSTIITIYPYELYTNYTIDGKIYADVYSLNITDASGTNSITKVFFTLADGVLQFETNANEIFNIHL